MVTWFAQNSLQAKEGKSAQHGKLKKEEMSNVPRHWTCVYQQMEDTRKLVRTELMSSKTELASLKQRLALLITWPVLNSRAQDAVRLLRLEFFGSITKYGSEIDLSPCLNFHWIHCNQGSCWKCRLSFRIYNLRHSIELSRIAWWRGGVCSPWNNRSFTLIAGYWTIIEAQIQCGWCGRGGSSLCMRWAVAKKFLSCKTYSLIHGEELCPCFRSWIECCTFIQARCVLFRIDKKDKAPASLQNTGGFVCCSQLPMPISVAHFEIWGRPCVASLDLIFYTRELRGGSLTLKWYLSPTKRYH